MSLTLSRKDLRKIIGKGGFSVVFLLPDGKTVARVRNQRVGAICVDAAEKALQDIQCVHQEIFELRPLAPVTTRPLGVRRIVFGKNVWKLAYIESLADGHDAFDYCQAIDDIRELRMFVDSIVFGAADVLVCLQEHFSPQGLFCHDDVRMENIMYNPRRRSVQLIDLDRFKIVRPNAPAAKNYTKTKVQRPVFNGDGDLKKLDEITVRVRRGVSSDMQTLLLSVWPSIVVFCHEYNHDCSESLRFVCRVAESLMVGVGSHEAYAQANTTLETTCDPREIMRRFSGLPSHPQTQTNNAHKNKKKK